jgi:hypothetical protein
MWETQTFLKVGEGLSGQCLATSILIEILSKKLCHNALGLYLVTRGLEVAEDLREEGAPREGGVDLQGDKKWQIRCNRGPSGKFDCNLNYLTQAS